MSRARSGALSIWKEREGDVAWRGGRRRKLRHEGEPLTLEFEMVYICGESRQAWLGHRRVLLRGNGC